MRGSDFANAYGKQGLAAWEAVAVDLARTGQLALPQLLPVPVANSSGTLRGVVTMTSDVLGVGEEGDVLRLPLTPGAAQAVADSLDGGYLLPTRKLVRDAWAVATKKMQPIPLSPNRGANMGQYVEHNERVNQALREAGSLWGEMVSGIKKDVVISNALSPGKVAIYGWIDPLGQPKQPLFAGHGDFYVDYSHGIRLVAPTMLVEGIGVVRTEDAYRDPLLSGLVSDEGPLKVTRYPTKVQVPSGSTTPTTATFSFTRVMMTGLQALVYYAERDRIST